jgi:hypothetical protein
MAQNALTEGNKPQPGTKHCDKHTVDYATRFLLRLILLLENRPIYGKYHHFYRSL